MERNIIPILSIISESPAVSQREIAAKTGLSLGMVNLVLQRLAKTGHIKISGLNKKRAAYLLTQKGVVELAQHSYSYVTRVLSVFKEYESRLHSVLKPIIENGETRFAVLGEGEIYQLVEKVLCSYPHARFRRIETLNEKKEDETILDCRWNGRVKANPGVSIMETLLQPDSASKMEAVL